MTTRAEDNPPPPDTSDSGPEGCRFVLATDKLLPDAAQALVGALAGDDPSAGRRFLRRARLHGIALTHFWVAVDSGERPKVRHACLVTPGDGGAGMVFTSRPATAEGLGTLSRLIDHAIGHCDDLVLAQALLTPDESSLAGPLLDAGFRWVGDLQYLRRPWQPPEAPGESWPDGVSVVRYTSESNTRLAAALEASYIDTLDCPELHGMRRTEEVIESHRGTGRFDPALWWIVERAGTPEGALLLNQCPDQDHCELVYLGLSPALRGIGLGRQLLRMGLREIERRPHRTMMCAVDSRNAPARALYESEGFHEFTTRAAYVRPAR